MFSFTPSVPPPSFDPPQEPRSNKGRFGAFSGVFTPSILTILGVVMYLRFGWVVGNAGLLGALVIVVLSHVITLATGLSISTIATHRTVGAGGAFNIISRSLGAPIGAAVGIPLFVAQALSVSFYCVGFTESIAEFVPWISPRVLTTFVAALLLLLSLRSASLVLKAQYVIMAAIGVSLVSFFAGTREPAPTLSEAPPQLASFSAVFAVFFPAVTGIMAGVGMSGDLKDPRRALPRGTLWAIFVGFVIYLAFPLWLANNASPAELLGNPRIVWDIAFSPAAIYVGIWGATLSSAVGSLLTAPRTLQAIARDRLVPRWLGKGHGPHDEPRIATALSFVIALGGIWLGNLDSIANTLTMFFLATYGITNLACGVELWAASPSFRPEFRIPWWISAGGAAACFYVMSLIDIIAMLTALLVCGGIYFHTQRRELHTTYGDARHGFWAALVRSALHRVRRAGFHPTNWRPNLLIMGGDLEQRHYLLELGDDIVQHRGLVTYFQLLRGDLGQLAVSRQRLLHEVEPVVREHYPNVFYRVDVVDSVHRGVVQAAQSYGLGDFEANTLLLGWPQKEERFPAYAQMMRDLATLDKSLLLVRYDPQRAFGSLKNIHIWWGGLKGNGGLMLLTAFLLTAQRRWRDARISLITVVTNEEEQQQVRNRIDQVLQHARVTAEPKVVVRSGRAIAAIMEAESQWADLAIIGLALPQSDEAPERYFSRMEQLLASLPTTLMVYSARSFPGEPVLIQD